MTEYNSWQTDAPLTPEEFDEDKPILTEIMNAIPSAAKIRTMEVWVHGREYRWQRVEIIR